MTDLLSTHRQQHRWTNGCKGPGPTTDPAPYGRVSYERPFLGRHASPCGKVTGILSFKKK